MPHQLKSSGAVARRGATRQSDRGAVSGCAAGAEPVYGTTDDQEEGDDVP